MVTVGFLNDEGDYLTVSHYLVGRSLPTNNY